MIHNGEEVGASEHDAHEVGAQAALGVHSTALDGRITDRIEFVAFLEELIARPDSGRSLQEIGVAAYPELQADIESGSVDVRLSGIGRGADAEAIALTLAAASGIVYVVAQTVDKVLDVALKAAELWAKIGSKKGSVVLSLGAIKALCVADLHREIESMDGVVLVWAGDIGGGLVVDTGHTGEDIFLVHLARVRRGEGRSWLYVVDSHGRVLQRTSFLQHPATYGKIVGSFEDVPPIDLYYLLDDDR